MVSDSEAADLVRRSLAGDPRAFESLVEAYQRVLFNVALRMVGDYEEAKDLTQVVFLKVYENLGRYDSRHRFFSWVYRILRNECLNSLRRARRFEPLDESIAAPGPDAEDALQTVRVDRALQGALSELSPENREVIVLRHFIQLSHREIAGLLEVPEKTVKSRIHTARQLLCGLLTKRGVARP